MIARKEPKRISATKLTSTQQLEIEKKIAALEAKVEVLLSLIQSDRNRPEPVMTVAPREKNIEANKVLRSMTSRQHAALQMVMAGKTNQEVAARFGTTENNAKSYIRSLFKHCGTNRREIVSTMLYEAFRDMPEDVYLSVAGIPKNWFEIYGSHPEVSDPYGELYQSRGRGHDEDEW